jgi:hypothetical protein
VVFLCSSTLINHFFEQHNSQANHANVILAEILMEAVIKIIEKVGEKFEVQTTGQMPEILDAIKKVVKKETKTIGEYDYSKLNTDEFFDILKYIDTEILQTQYYRVSALLKNLEERRNNGWKLHLVTETGPKTLNEVRKDVEEGEDRQEDKKVSKKSSLPTVDFEKVLQDIFAKYEKGSYMNEDVS